MKKQDVYSFAADKPIQTFNEDLLGRVDFSKDIADAILSWHGKDSLVVALHGDWGSGKTSIKNMVVEVMEQSEKNRPNIIEFSPWEWAGQEKITEAFFNEISTEIGRKIRGKSGKRFAEKLKKYGRYLATGEIVFSGLSKILPLLLGFFIFLGFGSSFLQDGVWIKKWTPLILAFLTGLALIFNYSKQILNSIGLNVEASVKANDQTLSDIREELKEDIIKMSSPLIIVMDDLDRLTSDQLKMLIQLIKANLEFPNLVFLLLFQRNVVEHKLSDGKQNGRDYLEKIIQVPFDIPRIETTTLHNILFQKIDGVIELDSTAKEMFDLGRWRKIFPKAMSPYFENLRNVYRYTSTLSFHFSLLKGKSVFEVNPVDLMAMECLRVFEPDIYREIAQSKDIFTYSSSRKKENDNSKLKTTKLLELTNEKNRDAVSEFIRLLFPNLNGSLGGTYTDKWLREMRICHPSNFDKYFQFSIPSGEISNSDLKEMLKCTSNSSAFLSFIASLEKRGRLKNALSQFKSFTKEIPLENGYHYIKALIEIGDTVDHKRDEFTLSSPHIQVTWLAIDFLREISSINKRGELLVQCYNDSDGISIVEYILQQEENHRKKNDPEILLKDDHFELLKKEFVKKIDDMADSMPDKLITHSHLASFLIRWKRWGNANKAIAWVKDHTTTILGCLNLLKAFLSESHSHSGIDSPPIIKHYIDYKLLEEFVDIDSIAKIIKTIDINEIDDESKIVVKAFYDANNQREQLQDETK